MDSNERNIYISYIHNHINDLKSSFRREVLQIILYSNIDDVKIEEKGSGTQVKFIDLDSNLIKSIYNFIYQKIELSTNII